MSPLLHLIIYQEVFCKHSTPLLISLHLPLPPPQSYSSLSPYHLFSFVSLHALFSDVVGANINSEIPSRKTNKPLIAWKMISMLLGHVIVRFLLLIVTEILKIRTKNEPCLTSFAVSSCVLTNIHVSTVPTLQFLVSIQRRHKKLGEFLSINIKDLALGAYQSGGFKMSQKN